MSNVGLPLWSCNLCGLAQELWTGADLSGSLGDAPDGLVFLLVRTRIGLEAASWAVHGFSLHRGRCALGLVDERLG